MTEKEIEKAAMKAYCQFVTNHMVDLVINQHEQEKIMYTLIEFNPLINETTKNI